MRFTSLAAFFLLTLDTEGGSLDLNSWVGKYSHDVDKNGHTLFQVPEVRTAPNRLLTKENLTRLVDTYSIGSPITLIQGFLVASQCMPHCCPCEHGMLVIDLNRRHFHIGFYKRQNKKVTIEWISSEGEFQNLPKEIQDEFFYGHNPR